MPALGSITLAVYDDSRDKKSDPSRILLLYIMSLYILIVCYNRLLFTFIHIDDVQLDPLL